MGNTKINLDEMGKKCLCKICPSFVDCKEKRVYCQSSKSKCIKQQKGCLCGGCPIHQELGLKGIYYCFSGKKA